MNDEFIKLGQTFFDTAQTNVFRDGCVVPVLVFFINKQITFLQIPDKIDLNDHRHKAYLAQKVKELCEQVQPSAIYFICEMWYYHSDEDYAEKKNKTEGMCVVCRTATGECGGQIARINRTGKEAWAEPIGEWSPMESVILLSWRIQ